jgi:hypothetical protein
MIEEIRVAELVHQHGLHVEFTEFAWYGTKFRE